MVVDETDGTEFVQGLKEYVEKRYEPDIFHRHPEFVSVSRQDENLIQLAGVISGSLGRVFEPSSKGAIGTQILGALRKKAISIDEWPRPTTPPQFDESTPIANEYDKQVYEYCVERVWSFINQRSHSIEEDVQRQVALAEYLLHYLRFENAQGYVQLSTLAEDLGLSGDMIRRNVIAGLRDYGVLIASSSRGGYKIPSCAKDLQDYVRMASELICPLLRRVGEARKALYAKTGKKLDIVGGPEHEQLRDLLPSVEGEILGQADVEEGL
jgi:biotin operon repressor